jgi:hypothetical protein
MGLLAVGAQPAWIPFYATIVSERVCRQIQVDSGRLYRALLERALPYLSGQTDRPPVPMRELIEPELAAIAALKSWSSGDGLALLEELEKDSPSYDGAAFAREYRKARYKW